jgi:predicted dehydrogenase
MKRLKVALVGCGGAGGLHCEQGFAALPDRFEFAIACDKDQSRREGFARRYDIPRVAATFDEVLAEADIDVVSICTLPSAHFEQIAKALNAGKHVICEKPLVASLAEFDQIATLAGQSRGRLMPIFQYRFGAGVERVKRVIDRGLAGRAYVSSVETSWRRGVDYYEGTWRGRFATELGGVLITQAIHLHDLLFYLIGPARAVTGFKTTRVNPVEVEDCAAGALQMADGSLAAITATLGSMRQISRLRLCFENVTFERESEGDVAYRPGDDPWTFTAKDKETESAIARAMAEPTATRSYFARQFELFADAIASGGPLPVALDDARRALELITAFFHASQTGAIVALPLGADHPGYRGWTS